MKIHVKTFNLEVSYDELMQIGMDLFKSLEYDLQRHWVVNQNEWQNGEQPRLIVMEKIYNSLERRDIYEAIYEKAAEIFDKYNEIPVSA